MKINAIKCPQCSEIIYSRARHDMQWCSCGDVAIDGGFEYRKICFKDKTPESLEIDLNVTKQMLYDDWNLNKNKYGKY